MERSLCIPRHVGIILDGNGRWAERQGLARTKGHAAGAENVVRVTRYCKEAGVEALSLYAFSTENWKRPKTEVTALMQLLIKFMNRYLPELHAQNVQLRVMGDVEGLPFATRKAVLMGIKKTEKNTGMKLYIGLNYGGRDEIIRAAHKVLQAGEALSEEAISASIDTAEAPALDLIIRTGGEVRLSNFMLWQAAYAELYFCEALWPDFDQEELHRAFQTYSHRNRRYGGLKG